MFAAPVNEKRMDAELSLMPISAELSDENYLNLDHTCRVYEYDENFSHEPRYDFGNKFQC